ncbi:uncharacterized protein PV09_04229 [Verruconis gallopava]|uniref:Cytochrome P450 n=1 Tax=Verruconis gallopava TaxID=253628 RepID=A0A0D1XQY3_9PEZI|nr:uncharacterized protein PV09_04229 [Verruconis gallopava]KIW05081.1 hypothetical protein PV09_04229 [Verruconis gallopava]
MVSTSLFAVLFALLLAYLLDACFCHRRHSQEPPYVRPRIPLVGHALGLALHGSRYYDIVRISPGQPEIFTLPIFSFRIYVLNSRHLFPVIIRNARTLSFRPFAQLASRVWCSVSEPFMQMHEEGHRWIEDLFRDTRNALAVGSHLDYQNLMAGESLKNFIDQLDEDVGIEGKKRFNIYKWIHHTITVAASDGVYGKNNPFRDPAVENDYWYVIWAQGIKKQTAKLPSAFLRKELAARERLFKAFEKYWTSDWSDAAEITKSRKRLYDRDEVALRDQAAHQASFNLALLGNTIPTSFWALYDIFTRPELLKAIRAEIETNALIKRAVNGCSTFELDVAALRNKCPLLLSSFQESQRTKSIHAMIREVISDTLIESSTTKMKYFLAQGQYVQMPSGPIHKDVNIWGPNAADFDPYRFTKGTSVLPKSELPNSYAFLPWGSPPHLCPARQFASTEVLLFIALMALRFEFLQAGGGAWKTLGVKTGELVTILPPTDEVLLDIGKREGFQGFWIVKMGESSQKVPLASG